MARFNFKGEDQRPRVLRMRNRVLLAKMLREPANLVILDEPTNDLDLDTLRVLEEAIEHYPGSMIIVTHDRFLNRVATHILAFEGDGKVVFHHGDYESYKDWKKAQGEDIDAKKGPTASSAVAERDQVVEVARARALVEAFEAPDEAQGRDRSAILAFLDAHGRALRVCVPGT